MKKNLLFGILGIATTFACLAQDGEWQALLDKDLTHWDKFIGVPHTTVKGLPDNVPKGNGMEGTPLGLNNDPLDVFSMKEVDGEAVLHISGQIYGGLTSKKAYENYHLKLEFKWGEKKWEPRLNAKRDNGLLYHCNGEHGAFWNVWMESQEFQIQEGDMGDYYGLAGGINTIDSYRNEEGLFQYDTEEETAKFGVGLKANKIRRCVRKADHEKPNGEWNTLELVCFNGKSYHIVNGMVVMQLDKAERKSENGFEVVTSGKIQLQSEAAEAFYKKIEIRKIETLPGFLKGN